MIKLAVFKEFLIFTFDSVNINPNAKTKPNIMKKKHKLAIALPMTKLCCAANSTILLRLLKPKRAIRTPR